MGKHLLYSTNPLLKFLIQKEFAGDVHYVWCSEDFNAEKADPYSLAGMVGTTSNPAEIYRDLVKRDRHNSKLKEQKLSMATRAHEWERDRKINVAQRDMILFMVNKDDLALWRPLLYVIHRDRIDDARIKSVKPEDAASYGPEYTIADLKREEFDLVEFLV